MPLPVVILTILIVVGMLLWFGAIADSADYPPAAYTAIGRNKGKTLWIIVLTLIVGAAWYWLKVRVPLRAADRAMGDPAAGDGG